ncbi:orotidine 5'-phosphate decarboxylase / HUMPS family protein [Nocardia sp. NPDC052278]|uniref:orotidine 5'-phosphate decarboxylase / HUMPS family protein n=1 Tax=unclassified Nocardia TaxID=2637762 RepID=UPI0036895A9A
MIRRMGSVVARWTGREARALREAKRMSVREFAAHLGVNDAAVSNWERRGADARLRYETQQILDMDLTQSGPDVGDRFELILRTETADEPTPVEVQAEEPSARAYLGDRSGQRTAVLLDAVGSELAQASYRPDRAAVERFAQFLDSPSRAFVLAGRAGSGKTRFTQHVADTMSAQADFQFHTCSTWTPASTDLATEILRYASLRSADDALLSLERASGSLERPCVVVIDGVDDDNQLVVVGRQVDSILRQANSKNLRFVIVARTPPELDLSAYPVLAAATFGPPGTAGAASYSLTAWTPAEARQVWEQQRHDDHVPLTALPESVQSLARIPLYMQMLCNAGDSAEKDRQVNGAFHLVDRCVRTLLASGGGHPVEVVINHLTQIACELMPEVIPESLTDAVLVPSDLSRIDLGRAGVPVVEQAPGGGIRFSHDVFREYFLATRIVEEMTARGRSAASVTAFNELAAHATRSAVVQGVFDFVVCALSTSAPNLVDMIALAPSTTLDAALPMLIESAAAQGISVSDDVLRACAHRCTQAPARQLARALLATPNLPAGLAGQHAHWVIKQLQIHGSQMWEDIARHIEHVLDIRISSRILERIDLDHVGEAAFVARHFDLFTTAGHDGGDLLEQLLTHLDWRVRAALAEALLGHRTIARVHVGRIVDRLVRDDDYKVRAAVARVVGTFDTASALTCLRTLLTDRNWHVRECALQGVLSGTRTPLPDPALSSTVIATAASETDWVTPPASAMKLLTRIHLLGTDSSLEASAAVDESLFGLLREIRTGWIALPPGLEQSLIARGESSTRWLTTREARATRRRYAVQSDIGSVGEQYRRRRGRRSLQVALDVHSLDRAITIARAAVDAGSDFIEVGDPLIKRSGVAAIAAVKRAAPDTTVVAEMMSADWGRDQVELAAEAGADVVLLIGPASTASVSAAVTAARRLGVALVLDTPHAHVNPAWLRDMERTGIDGFVVTTNIDLGVGSDHPLATARTIRSYSQLPLAVSGGFSTADDELTSSTHWDIAIIGRSIADAVAPTDLAYQLTSIVRKIHAQERP